MLQHRLGKVEHIVDRGREPPVEEDEALAADAPAAVRLHAEEAEALSEDVGETNNLAAARPEVVKQLLALAETARTELGDALTQRTGSGLRPRWRGEGREEVKPPRRGAII